jgi:hypothetical protein
MPIHAREQELWFGLGKLVELPSPAHETSCLPEIPGALRLVENYDMLEGRAVIDQRIIAKVMDVLNERLDAFGNLPLSDLFAGAFLPRHLIPGQRFTEDGHKGAIPRQKHCMGDLLQLPSMSRRHK